MTNPPPAPPPTTPDPAAPPRAGWAVMLPTLTPMLVTGLVLVGSIVLFGVIGPLVVQDPDTITTARLTAPDADHLLGRTQTGQDVFAQLAFATRGSLQIGLLVGTLATLLSAFFGILGSYLGGIADEAFSLFTNVMLVIPGLPLVIVISGFVPPEQRGLWTIALILAITSWSGASRVLRAQTLSIRNRDYVAASRVAGEPAWRVIGVEILPNLLPVLAAQFVFAVISAILGEAGLSFLGLGASNSSTLGTMLFYAQNGFALQLRAWWWFFPPGLVIAVFGCGLALINFSIDEVINPRLRNARLHARRQRASAAKGAA